MRAALLPALYEFSYWYGQQSAEPRGYSLLVSLPDYSEIDDAKANCGEDKRKYHTVFEDLIGQVCNIAGRTEPAEYGEHSARKRRPNDDHQEVDAKIDELVQFTVRAHQR